MIVLIINKGYLNVVYMYIYICDTSQIAWHGIAEHSIAEQSRAEQFHYYSSYYPMSELRSGS